MFLIHLQKYHYQDIKSFFLGSGDAATELGLDATTQTGVSQAGLSNGAYTRLVATASKTLDNGLEVIGVYSIMKDSDNLAVMLM